MTAAVRPAIAALPPAHAVVLAFGTPCDNPDPLPSPARRIAALYQDRAQAARIVDDRSADDTITAAVARAIHQHDHAIAAHIDEIDRWATSTCHSHRCSILHTETLGTLLTRMAQIWQRGHNLRDQALLATLAASPKSASQACSAKRRRQANTRP